MNRLGVVRKIDDLQDRHCKTCTLITTSEKRKGSIRHCIKHCQIGKRLQELGSQLKTRERKTVGEKKLVLDQDSYKELSASGKTDAEISRHFGIKQATLSYHKKKWFNEAVKPNLKVIEPVEVPAESKPTRQDKTAEYAALINELSDKVKRQDSLILDLQAKVDEYENVKSACNDMEAETVNLRKEVDYLSNKRLEEEELYLDTLEQLEDKNIEYENLKNATENNKKVMESYVKENQSLRNMVKELVSLWA